jgi:hypothetical protein
VDLIGQHQFGLLSGGAEISVLAGLFLLAWSFLEELALRGYLVVEKRGAGMLIFSIIGYSLLVGLFVGETPFGKGVGFMTSMWYFALRFCRWNPERSLLPSIVAHVVISMGLIVTKALQGKISGLW